MPSADRRSVLMVSENYLPVMGGTEKQLATLSAALRGRDVLVEIVTARNAFSSSRRETSEGVPIYRVPYPRIPRLGAVVLLARLVAFLLREGARFDLFHVHTVSSMAVATVAVARLLGKPVVLKPVGKYELEEGVLSPPRRAAWLYRPILSLLGHADVWVAVSEELREAVVEAGIPRERVVVIPNGVDVRHFARREPSNVHARAPHVVFAGRLAPEKGLGVLLEAWSKVLTRVPNAVLDVIGAGRLEAELRATAERLGIARDVVFHGRQPDIAVFLRSADLFVLPSFVEGLSNALLEAMAAGVPVVATRVGGNVDLVDHGVTGRLVTPGDPHEIAEAICESLEDQPHAAAMAREAQSRVTARCGLDTVVDRYLAVYAALVGEGR